MIDDVPAGHVWLKTGLAWHAATSSLVPKSRSQFRFLVGTITTTTQQQRYATTGYVAKRSVSWMGGAAVEQSETEMEE
jgi:hypothetical protein